MTREALDDVTKEERRLREYILVVRAAFNAVNGEADEAKATMVVTHAELTGNLDSTFFGFYPYLLGAVLSFFAFFPGVKEQLIAAQAEVTKLWWANEDLVGQLAEAAREWNKATAWARSSDALV